MVPNSRREVREHRVAQFGVNLFLHSSTATAYSSDLQGRIRSGARNPTFLSDTA